MALGYDFSCARFTDGKVKCWGGNASGVLGQGHLDSLGDDPGEMEMLLPIDLGTGRTAIAIGATFRLACALLDNGDVKCWGDNGQGAVGVGDTEDRGDEPNEMGDALPAIDFGVGRTALALGVNFRGACAVLDNGAIKCWGQNAFGQAGLGTVANESNYVGDQVGEVANHPGFTLGGDVRALDGGNATNCALLVGGSVKCWGSNVSGLLGQGDAEDRGDSPGEVDDQLPPIALGKVVTQLSVLDEHACVLFADQTVSCWGRNTGSLALGDADNRGDAPGEVGQQAQIGDMAVVQIAVASEASCALFVNERVKCWGDSILGVNARGDVQGDDPSELGDALPFLDLGPP
jgi:alpha-tubulin suppressor-like RCC1 family protein